MTYLATSKQKLGGKRIFLAGHPFGLTGQRFSGVVTGGWGFFVFYSLIYELIHSFLAFAHLFTMLCILLRSLDFSEERTKQVGRRRTESMELLLLMIIKMNMN